MKVRGLSALLVLALSLAAAPPSLAQQTDMEEIRDLQKRQADAWNRHDAAAYAKLFTDDGDVVNVLGWWWKSPTEIRSKLDDAFAFVFRDNTLTITDVQIRFIQPTVAIAHVSWTMDGARSPPGVPTPPRSGIQLQVLTRQSGRWLIASFQNTNSVPEMPFPRGPGASKP